VGYDYEKNINIMKRLCVFDFDGTLIDSPQKEDGKKQWEEKMGQPYPYDGWWGRKESLDTNVFDIKPFPSILAKLQKDMADPDTSTIILTSRMEKLRPQLENILKLNGIAVDELITKRGREDKGDVILRIENYNQDLKEIVVYDDFAGRMANKIAEYSKIKDKLSDDVKYIINYVENGNIRLLEGAGIVSFESTNKLLNMINEEIQNVFGENIETLISPINIYHGGDPSNLNGLIKNPKILSPEKKMKLLSNTGGYLIGLSTSRDVNNARKYSNGFGHSKALQLQLDAGAKVIKIDTDGAGVDEIYIGEELEELQKRGIDAVIELDDGAEKEVRILNSKYLKVIGVV